MSEKLLNQILEKLNGIEDKVANIETKVTGFETKFVDLENKFANLENKVANIESKFIDLESKVANIESKVANIESVQQEHTQLLRALEHRTGVISATVTALDETIQRSEGRIVSLEKSLLSTKEEVELNRKETLEKMESLDSSIMYLANKITQHDMQLFDIKRRAR